MSAQPSILKMNCTHAHAYPSLDSKTGWYCPSCCKTINPPIAEFTPGDRVQYVKAAAPYREAWVGHYAEVIKVDRGSITVLFDGDTQAERINSDSLALVQPFDSLHQKPTVERSVMKSAEPSLTVRQSTPEANCRTVWQVVEKYRCRNLDYYRYRWGRGSAIAATRHIPGGNIRNRVTQARATEVNRWIAQGRTPEQVLQLIDRWRYNRTTSDAPSS